MLTGPNAILAGLGATELGRLGILAVDALVGAFVVPIGLHVTWNFFEGSVYGFPISASGYGMSLVGMVQGGPDLVTGTDSVQTPTNYIRSGLSIPT